MLLLRICHFIHLSQPSRIGNLLAVIGSMNYDNVASLMVISLHHKPPYCLCCWSNLCYWSQMTSQMTVNLCSWETEYRTMNVIHSQLRSRPHSSLLWIWNRINLVILMKKFICTFFFINLSYATVSLKHHFIFISAGKERLLRKFLFYLLAWNIKFIINKFLRS